MSIYLTKRPRVDINHHNLSYRPSRWNAVHNPIRLVFQRKDVQGSVIAYSSYNSKLKITWTGSNPSLGTFFSAGDKIFVGGHSLYNKVATITHVFNSYIITDIAYYGNPNARFLVTNAFHPNYHIQIELWDSEKNISYGTWKGSGNSNGLITADISGLLKKELSAIDESDFTSKNQKLPHSYGKIEFKYRETAPFNLGYLAWINGGEVFYWTNSAKQIKELYSGNMGQYVPFNDTNTDEDKKMKFLIEGRPTHFIGYPFDLSWIYPEGFETNIIERHQQNRNFNGSNTTAEQTTNLFHSEKRGVNTLLPGTIDANATQFDIWLEQGGTIPTDGYTIPTFITPGYTSKEGSRPMPGAANG